MIIQMTAWAQNIELTENKENTERRLKLVSQKNR